MNSQTMMPRAGKNYRTNPDRYFHVMTEGWFLYMREGIQGPFVDREHAKSHLTKMLSDMEDEKDPSASWRL